jgi:hypothetical protein
MIIVFNENKRAMNPNEDSRIGRRGLFSSSQEF